ncbi:MAG: hypothetical protein GY830_04355 [Bacteroidetes bacterium]|nr:hypothetical protein [Bacteroidota bacterium]
MKKKFLILILLNLSQTYHISYTKPIYSKKEIDSIVNNINNELRKNNKVSAYTCWTDAEVPGEHVHYCLKFG